MHDPIQDFQNAVSEAACAWYKIRLEIFSKKETDMTDWNKLANAEHCLMKACKELTFS